MKRYKYSNTIAIDFFEEGGVVSLLDTDRVICLGKHESDLLKSIVEEGLEITIQKMQERYDSDMGCIERDIKDYYIQLQEMGVLIEE